MKFTVKSDLNDEDDSDEDKSDFESEVDPLDAAENNEVVNEAGHLAIGQDPKEIAAATQPSERNTKISAMSTTARIPLFESMTTSSVRIVSCASSMPSHFDTSSYPTNMEAFLGRRRFPTGHKYCIDAANLPKKQSSPLASLSLLVSRIVRTGGSTCKTTPKKETVFNRFSSALSLTTSRCKCLYIYSITQLPFIPSLPFKALSSSLCF